MWILLTLGAVTFQVIRNGLQKTLKKQLSDTTITWTRFLFSLPIILSLLTYICFTQLASITSLPKSFFIYCALAGLFQILGNISLVNLFGKRNFTVGITYMKTETVQTAIIATILLGEFLDFKAINAVILATLGVILLSPLAQQGKKFFSKLFDKTALIGIACGFFFTITAIFIKKAILITEYSGFYAALLTLLFMNLAQNILLLFYTAKISDLKTECHKLANNLKPAAAIGVLSFFGSICWFYAFALADLTLVKLVGQTEVIFSFFISHRLFKEEISRLEIAGIILIMLSIILII